MANVGRGGSRKKFNWMGGGLVTRPDSHHIEQMQKGKTFLLQTSNIDFQKMGSIQKRNDFLDLDVTGGTGVFSWTTSGNKYTVDNFATFTTTAGKSVTSTSANTIGFCVQLTATQTRNITTMYFPTQISDRSNKFKNIQVTIRANTGGNPGAILTNASQAIIDGYELSTAQVYPYYYFPTPVPLTNGSSYWVCLQAEVTESGLTMTGGNVSFPYPSIFTDSVPNHGIYDYKTNIAGATVQTVMAVESGTIWYYNGATWASLVTGLSANTANDLFDFATMKNILFIADNANTKNLMWDQVQSTTSPAGYRGTMNAPAQSGSAGGPWSAAGVVKVMLVTQLTSGGYRASAVFSITLAGTTNKIDLTGIAVDAIAAQFSTFDIGATATTIYCTLPNGSIYYKVPSASLSTAGNPIANTQTTNSILPMTDATLIAGGSLETNLSLPTGYFTNQVNTPKTKYLQVWQDFLVMAGDPAYPSSIWISEQYAPNIWSTYGKSYGVRIDVNTDDGEIVTGLGVADGALFVTKQHNIFRIDYTGDFNDPFRTRLVHGQIGCLSHFTIATIPDGLYFLSERGPSICYGNYSQIIPQTALIQDLFSNSSTQSLNLSAMRYSTGANDTSRNQMIISISQDILDVNSESIATVTTRNKMLVYDYEQKQFFLWDHFNANYLAIVSDANNFPRLWFGDLGGYVYQREDNYGNQYIANLPGELNVLFLTPDLDLGEPTYYKEGVFLEIGGEVISADTFSAGPSLLAVDVFLDKSSTARATLIYDMSKSNFKTGISVPVPGKFKTIKLRFRNRDFNYGGMTLYWMDFTFQTEGVRH